MPGPLYCYTDRPYVPDGVIGIDVSTLGLQGWWAKMALFNARVRPAGRVIYLDLDTVIAGDLQPLAQLDVDFGICANFTRRAGNVSWPCNYGSCVMSFADGWGTHIWDAFNAKRKHFMDEAGRLGDQWVIEQLHDDAALLQDELPKGFFVGYRELPMHKEVKPPEAHLIIFAGNHKPDNCQLKWIRRLWP